MKKMLAILVLITLSAMPSANAASVKGSQGQILSVSKTTAKSGAILTVSGQYFDETVGIYLAFCVVPKRENHQHPVVVESIRLV